MHFVVARCVLWVYIQGAMTTRTETIETLLALYVLIAAGAVEGE